VQSKILSEKLKKKFFCDCIIFCTHLKLQTYYCNIWVLNSTTGISLNS